MRNRLTPAEWQDLFEKFESEWGDEIAKFDTSIRAIYMTESAALPSTLHMLAVLFHSHYVAAYLAATMAKSGLYPQDVLDGLATESTKMGLAAADESGELPEDMINMPGGEA